MLTSTPSPASMSTCSNNRTKRTSKSDEAITSVSSAITKMIENRSSSEKELKFKDFYEELDAVLRNLPYIEAMKFNLNVMQQANDLLKQKYETNEV